MVDIIIYNSTSISNPSTTKFRPDVAPKDLHPEPRDEMIALFIIFSFSPPQTWQQAATPGCSPSSAQWTMVWLGANFFLENDP